MSVKCPKCQTENPDTQKFCGECATPLPFSEGVSVTKTLETPVEGLKRGTTFAGRYEIIEELGKGGMGTVYKALDKELSEEVALKLIKPEIAADKKTIERFKNELKLARKIGHRNVGRMYEIMEEEGKPFITMEFIEGEDLKNHVRREERLSSDEAVSIAKQVCEGLSEAHELGVIHRDLKPQNIMIDDKGKAKIMDFGIARSVEAPGVTATGIIIGTPDYISPEQAEGEEADQRSDIYSLGVILYEMVTGRVPFKGDTALSVALKHKAQLPSDPRKLNPDVSENLSRLILICMEKDRERRYQTAKDLLSDLRDLEEGFPLGTKIQPRRKAFATASIRKKLFIPALVIISLAIIGVIIWQLLPQKKTTSSPPSKSSIAVLPFKDMSPQKDQEYFCDGMADSIINALTHIKDLQVVARTSAFSFKGKEQDVREIGKKLNVNTVLEGSVQKAGNRIRITAQLINVEDGFHLWSDRYERELDDIFAIQDEISLAVVDKLKLRLLRGEKARLVKRHTENPEAYKLYLKGLYFWNKRTEEGMSKGMEYFEQAIENDPAYALAYAGLANSYNTYGFWGFLRPKEAFPKAKDLAMKALEMDDTLAEAYTALAWINLVYDWEWPAAERGFKRAIELNPGSALAHQWHAVCLTAMGRHDEAIEEIQVAQQLDPLSLIINANKGVIFFLQRNYDRALEQLRKTLEMNPNFSPALYYTGQAYVMKGMYEEAIEAFQKWRQLGSIYAVGWLGYIYAISGERDKSENLIRELKRMSKERYVPPMTLARIYLGLDENDKTFEWLEKAYEERESPMFMLKGNPAWDSIRSDPRYIGLMKKMGLEK